MPFYRVKCEIDLEAANYADAAGKAEVIHLGQLGADPAAFNPVYTVMEWRGQALKGDSRSTRTVEIDRMQRTKVRKPV